MVLLRTISIGMKSVLLHPLRSLLTVLGIFIGVASVIWLLAIGAGISQKAQEQIRGLGADNIIVRSVKPATSPDGNTTSFVLPYGLLREDFETLIETVPTIASALPIREIVREVQYQDRALFARVVGCTPDYADVTQLLIERGHFVTDAELKTEQNHCVLAAEVAETLFPYQDPIGRRIYLPEPQDYYQIVGVLRPRQPTAAIGGSLAAQDFSQDIYIPITTLRRRIGDTVVVRRSGSREGETVELNQITLRIDDIDHVMQTADLVEQTLERTHGQRQDVRVIVPKELLEQAETTRVMFMVFMGIIAGISLLVGGIGIMNIMLATVTERTREIGIRRALGAKREDIVLQFLIETTVLTVAGGLFGVLLGAFCPKVVNLIKDEIARRAPELMAALPTVVIEVVPILEPWYFGLAFFISTGIGILFGIYPACRAAMMDPIEALRHE
ncbi:MAG: ABC transporter permease [Pirellulaceae bacterium]|nr:ABC transporter permease [Pirellulaceae bacterium]